MTPATIVVLEENAAAQELIDQKPWSQRCAIVGKSKASPKRGTQPRSRRQTRGTRS